MLGLKLINVSNKKDPGFRHRSVAVARNIPFSVLDLLKALFISERSEQRVYLLFPNMHSNVQYNKRAKDIYSIIFMDLWVVPLSITEIIIEHRD